MNQTLSDSSFIVHPSSFPWRYAFCCTFPILPPGRPGMGRWALPTTASCGARTFLSPQMRAATVRPACTILSFHLTMKLDTPPVSRFAQ